MCTHTCLFYSFPLVLFGDALLLLSSCRREGVLSVLPGLRGLLGVRFPVDVPVAPYFREFFSYMFLRFRCIRYFVIIVINNICTRVIISFYVICAVIYCSFCCIYVWLYPGTYMIARFMSFYKPSVTPWKKIRQKYGTQQEQSLFKGQSIPSWVWVDQGMVPGFGVWAECQSIGTSCKN